MIREGDYFASPQGIAYSVNENHCEAAGMKNITVSVDGDTFTETFDKMAGEVTP